MECLFESIKNIGQFLEIESMNCYGLKLSATNHSGRRVVSLSGFSIVKTFQVRTEKMTPLLQQRSALEEKMSELERALKDLDTKQSGFS